MSILVEGGPDTSGQLSSRDRTAIWVLLVSVFVVTLNETVMSVALPVLMTELQVEASVGQWLTAGFLLTMSVVIPVTGFLIRRVPTRALFATAMALFSAGTLLAAVAPGFGALLAGRVVQAAGTAIMMPLLMTTVMTLVPAARRGALMGNIAIVMSMAPAIGPTVSGIVLDSLGWRYIFWLMLPIALAVLLLGLRQITNVGDATSASIDVLSVVLAALGFGGLVYGLSSLGSSGGMSQVTVWATFLAGVAGVVAFVARQLLLQRADHALLDLRPFRSRTFTVASVMMMLTMATLLGTAVLLPIYLQSALVLEPLTTGLVLLPGGLLMGVLGPVVGRLYDRFGARKLLVPGTVATSAALWSGTLLTVESSPLQAVGFSLLLSAGLAFVFTPLFAAGLGSVPSNLYAYGSAIFSTVQQLAGAAGVALLVSVLSVRSAALVAEGVPLAEQTAGGVQAALFVAATLSLFSIAGAFLIRGSAPAAPSVAH
jgi:DHA2 family lincomycin resistance protein-like MFS transporter